MLEKRWLQAAAVLALYMPAPPAAQSEELIVVTGSRNERGSYDAYYDEQQSAIGLTRIADKFVKPIYINSDSRGPEIRRAKVTAMLQETIRLAAKEGIALIAGDYRLVPLTEQTLKNL